MTAPSAVRPPSWRRQAMEARWPLEAAALTMVGSSCPLLGRGDGHPVVVLPGFAADDVSTVPLRWALAAHGYAVHGWRLGRNMGPTSRAVAGMRALVEEFHLAGGQRVTLVGWSLGGIYARLLARERPALVRQVITLASPYRMVQGDRSVATPLWRRVEHLHDGDLPMGGIAEDARPPLTVPATSIYTRDDGIVRWQLCVDEVGPAAPNPRAENIEVQGTHIGLGLNPAAVVAILDRLARREDDWQPFRPPLALRPWYPRPVSWSPDAGRRAA